LVQKARNRFGQLDAIDLRSDWAANQGVLCWTVLVDHHLIPGPFVSWVGTGRGGIAASARRIWRSCGYSDEHRRGCSVVPRAAHACWAHGGADLAWQIDHRGAAGRRVVVEVAKVSAGPAAAIGEPMHRLLAAKSGVAAVTVKGFEWLGADSKMSTLNKLMRALETASVEFIDDGAKSDEGGPGVRLK